MNHPAYSTRESGFSILEVVVSMLISSLVFAGLIQQLRSSVEHARDHQVRLETFVQAQALMQTIGAELRMAGNGVPFDQKNFVIGDVHLSDSTVTEPLVLSECTSGKIAVRVNETGDVFLLTSDFNPASSLTISLTDVEKLQANDPIYISNSVISGDDGLYGVVTAVNTAGKTVTIDDNYVMSPGAVFGSGSILEEVPVVTYQSVGGEITRDSGFGPVLLGPNSTLALRYLDIDGNEITPPMYPADLINRLRSIEITVTMRSERTLSTTKEPYEATVTQKIGIRNLDYLF